ncbi:MBL fold metallo-hydrolase [Pelagicoccus sp. SDUM812003]|uniref:MBL fold metallo-hydrolase n=1 Tax=Pelagicoccus sp. SDUM812003 TaxID=3041267 RepID=UPI00280ECFB8|nr:MBL fold metallo-hydrolase [Pelagicoccus sp. SDUM812003]MDQ8202259.1 MBL fold metallo-hydrolase [Pelagicoccus sp. SDUM812003]
MEAGDRWKIHSGLKLAEETGNAYPERCDVEGSSELPQIVWLGHGCFFIRWGTARLVIDPVFSKWIGTTRRLVPSPDCMQLKPVDLVLLSHGHMDHLNSASVAALEPKGIVLPRKTERFLARALRPLTTGLSLGERFQCEDIEIEIVPAAHGGWRYPWQRGYFACGYILRKDGKACYLAGDTANGPHFAEIGKRDCIDVAVLPIGAYAPRWFLKTRHINPEEACRAALQLGAKRVIPGHFGSYRLSLEPMDEPMRRFLAEAKRLEIDWRLPYAL